MKQASTLLILVLFSTVLFAQKNRGTSTEESTSTTSESKNYSDDEKLYRTALEYGDLTVAKTAVYQMLADDPSRTDLLDTLTVLYFIQGAYGQSINLGEKVLENNASNLAIREIVAISYKNVNAVKEALGHFEKLYAGTQDIFFLYEIASMQFSLQRFGECINSCDAILASEKAAETKVSININQNQSQEVNIAAAVLNMKGFIAIEVNQLEAAAQNFNAALEIEPEFVLPQANLQQLAKMQAEEGNATE